MPTFAPLTSPISLPALSPIEQLAVGTLTIGGTTGSGPTVSVVINGVTTLYTYTGGDTTAALAAQHIAAAINSNAAASALVTATSQANVVSFTSLAPNWNMSGMYSYSAAATGGATVSTPYPLMDLPSAVIPKSSFVMLGDFGPKTFYANIASEVTAADKNLLRTNNLIL